jgi:hypothetical protein
MAYGSRGGTATVRVWRSVPVRNGQMKWPMSDIDTVLWLVLHLLLGFPKPWRRRWTIPCVSEEQLLYWSPVEPYLATRRKSWHVHWRA